MATEKGQRKGKFPLPLHSIPSTHWTRKCQVCARSKLSGMPPAAHRSGDLVIGWSGDRRTGRHWDMGAKSFGMLIGVGKMDQQQTRASALHAPSVESRAIGMRGAKCFAILIELRVRSRGRLRSTIIQGNWSHWDAWS